MATSELIEALQALAHERKIDEFYLIERLEASLAKSYQHILDLEYDARVIIGEVLLGRVFRNFALKLVSVVIGAVIYYVVIQIVLQLGLNTNDLKLLTALVVALFLAVPYWKTIVLPKKKEV